MTPRSVEVCAATLQSMRFVHMLPSDSRALLSARNALEEWCRLEDTEADDIVIIANELCANAIRHSTGSIRLSATSTATHVNVSVEQDADMASTTPRLLAYGELDVSGRGLHIVSTIAQSWGWRLHAHRLIVWAHLNRHLISES